jgi:hypothetical protein
MEARLAMTASFNYNKAGGSDTENSCASIEDANTYRITRG